MAGARTRLGGWAVVLVGVLLMGAAWAALAGLFFMPQGGLVLVGGGIIAFLGLQAVIFRSLGLRSRADAVAGDDDVASDSDGDEDDDREWRAWRG